MMALTPKYDEYSAGKSPLTKQLIRQNLDIYCNAGKSVQSYQVDSVKLELERIARGEAFWKKIYLKDIMWNSRREIEILANPVHMAIIIGNEDLALQIYERNKIAYEKDEITEMVRYSARVEKVLKIFSIIDVFVAFASNHKIWGQFISKINERRSYPDEVIFNNVFLQYKELMIFPISDHLENLLIQRIQTMESGIPGFFEYSNVKTESDHEWIGLEEPVTILQKACIFMQALQGNEQVVTSIMELYLKDITYICSARDIHFTLSLNEMMEKMESLCKDNEKLGHIFFGFLLVLATKQEENMFFDDCVTPFFLSDASYRSKESKLTHEYYKKWAKKRKSDLNMADYYNLVKNIYRNEELAIRMTNMFNSL